MDSDVVGTPEHYTYGGIQLIDVWEACLVEGLDPVVALYLGNILKYLHRWEHKNGLQDLKKAARYEQMIVDHLRSKKGGCEV